MFVRQGTERVHFTTPTQSKMLTCLLRLEYLAGLQWMGTRTLQFPLLLLSERHSFPKTLRGPLSWVSPLVGLLTGHMVLHTPPDA